MISLYHYRVEVSDGSGLIRRSEEKFDVNLVEIIGENERFVVVKDYHFTTIQKDLVRKETPTYSVIDRPSISIWANDKCWGNQIWYTLYSTKTVKASVIKRQIEKEIEKKFGYFIGKIDLSFIK